MKNKIIALLLSLSVLSVCNVTAVASGTQAMSVTPSAEYSMIAGSTVHVLPRYTAATGTSYSYASTNTAVCTVDYDGNVTAVSEGVASIIVKRTIESANANIGVTATVTAKPISLSSVQSKDDNLFAKNEPLQIKVRENNFVGSSADATLATPTPVKEIEGWGVTITPTATPSPIPTDAPTITATLEASSAPTQAGYTGTASGGGTVNQETKTSVVSYAVYTIRVYPLTINCSKETAGPGDTIQFATNVANKVLWSVDNEDSETVEDNGINHEINTDSKDEESNTGTVFDLKLNDIKPGKLKVNAYLNGVKVTKEITIRKKSESQLAAEKQSSKKAKKFIETNGFSFNDYVDELAVGDTVAFSTNIDKISQNAVTWTTSDKNIASVSSNGVVTALSAGTVKIKASYDNNTITKNVTVVEESVLKFTNQTDIIAEGDSFTFTTNKGKNVKWTSENSNVATVKKGKVTGVSMGVTKITATFGDATLVKTISVTGDNNLMHITSKDNVVHIGEMIAIETNRENVTYSVNKPSIASIDKTTGILTGKSTGTVIVTAVSGNESVKYVITVNKGVGDLTFIGMKNNYSVGEHCYISTNKKNSSFISTNTSVASINQTTGELELLSPGVTMIYAFNGSEQISKQITVSSLSKDAIFSNLTVGDTVKLETSTGVSTWSSSNDSVARVDSKTGELEAVGEGKCFIYKYADSSIAFIEIAVHKSAYDEKQAKEISKLNNYISSLLLAEDGETLRDISQSNVDTILPHLRTIKTQLIVCEDMGIDVKSLPYYTYYDAALNQYLLSAHSYADGKMITLEDGKQRALASIDEAIVSLTSMTDLNEMAATIETIDDMILSAQNQYLVQISEIDSYDILTDYRTLVSSEKEWD